MGRSYSAISARAILTSPITAQTFHGRFNPFPLPIGKSQGVGLGPTDPTPYLAVGTTTRLHTIAWLKDSVETRVDFDSGAEVDCVSIEFVKTHQLEREKLTTPALKVAGDLGIHNYGAFRVPLIFHDSRGATRSITRPCVAINRDPASNSPVLLSMTTLIDHRIHLIPWKNEWWFESITFDVCSPHQFAKACRNKLVSSLL